MEILWRSFDFFASFSFFAQSSPLSRPGGDGSPDLFTIFSFFFRLGMIY